MKKGLARFDFFLTQLQTLLERSSKQKNPALWLYQNNARTPLFMLEGLAKLYSGIHNKNKFAKLKAHFKVLEDAFGQIDYYDAFAKSFAGNKKIPKPVLDYLQAQSREKIQSLNEILTEKGWTGTGAKRLEKIRKKLANADWENEKEETGCIHQFYTSSINNILEFLNQKDFHFDDVENDLHETRRMLRWLSIYPQALKGSIQLSKPKASPKYLAKYLTKEITGSPYNVMPDAADLKYFLLLDKNRFYALSWMVAELGKLKDSGLKVQVVKEALLQTSSIKEKEALAKAYQITGPKQLTIQQALTAAGNLCKGYCKEKNLESLITGTATIKK